MKAVLITPIVVAAAIAAASCGDDSGQDSADPTTAVSVIGSSTASGAPDSAQVDLAHHSFPVSPTDALNTAKKNFDGTLSKLELEREGVNTRNTYVYKVEMLSDTEKYTIQLAADSGAVISEHKENLDADERGTERTRKAVDYDRAVPLNDAMATASKARSGPIEKWKIEGKDNSAQYEFDVQQPGATDDDYEVQVDAYSGQLKTTG
ncbi:PepSY domain-containing protein [Nocardia sp. CS682]|uniref:PepSY domain-containing protein n=1 Tax=Nocardia sp. CS682 TaxID=1047172 RepID=UPI001074D9ED|nr:PepSY domain-containing protein [Nocardia sp. CS682]QBS39173.1 hypothetical protein DMB37_02645 [Nocardia sp. CS682]